MQAAPTSSNTRASIEDVVSTRAECPVVDSSQLDHDLALALHLQQEEQERLDLETCRLANQRAARSSSQQERSPTEIVSNAQAPPVQPARPNFATRLASIGRQAPDTLSSAKKSSDCSIM